MQQCHKYPPTPLSRLKVRYSAHGPFFARLRYSFKNFQIIQLLFPKLFPFLSYYSEKWFIIFAVWCSCTHYCDRKINSVWWSWPKICRSTTRVEWQIKLSKIIYSNQILPIIPTLRPQSSHHCRILFQNLSICTVYILCSNNTVYCANRKGFQESVKHIHPN